MCQEAEEGVPYSQREYSFFSRSSGGPGIIADNWGPITFSSMRCEGVKVIKWHEHIVNSKYFLARYGLFPFRDRCFFFRIRYITCAKMWTWYSCAQSKAKLILLCFKQFDFEHRSIYGNIHNYLLKIFQKLTVIRESLCRLNYVAGTVFQG